MHLFFFPSSRAVGMFQAEIQVQPKLAAFFFICKARLQCVITMPNWERALFPSQVGYAMGIFPFALGLFLGRISLITVQTGFISFLRERRYPGRQPCSPCPVLLSQFTILFKP